MLILFQMNRPSSIARIARGVRIDPVTADPRSGLCSLDGDRSATGLCELYRVDQKVDLVRFTLMMLITLNMKEKQWIAIRNRDESFQWRYILRKSVL